MFAQRPVVCAFLCLLLPLASVAGEHCPKPIAWQVLGSGGPELNHRAQSGHVLWIGGKARAIFDAGAGTAVAFGKAQGRIEDVDLIALSHLHTDHSADVPAYLNAAFFSERRRDLPLFGPPGSTLFPSTESWAAALLGQEHTAYPYLSGFMQPNGAAFQLQPMTLHIDDGHVATVFANARMTVKATPVKHGAAPALAWRVEAAGRSVVYLGDTDATAPALIELARRADLLVVNLAIAEQGNDDVAASLHAPPSRLGALARRAGVRHVVISHLMRRSEQSLPESLRIMRRAYGGPVDVAHDGLCLPLPEPTTESNGKGPV